MPEWKQYCLGTIAVSQHKRSRLLDMLREGQGENSLSSSLPRVLLPYLLQQGRDSVSNPSTTDRQVPPIAPLTREMGTLSTNGSPQQSLSPVSVSPTPAFSYTGNHGSPRFYPPYARPDLEMSNEISFGSGDPQVSGVRHTLGTQNVHSTVQRYSSPIYSDPIYHTSRPSPSFRTGQGYPLPQPPLREQFSRPGWTNWREGEPGPSSLTSFPRSPIAAHQLARLNQQTDAFNGPIWPEEQPDGFSSHVLTQTEGSRHSLRAGVGIPSQRLYEPRPSHHSPTIQELPPPPALFPGSEVPSPAIYGSRHEVYDSAQDLTRSPVGQRTWPSDESPSGPSLIPPLIPANHERASSEAQSIGTEERDDGSKPAQRKKRRREPVNSTQKDEKPKKTAVACNFCRGRKLKCDGEKPTCGVCGKRGLNCEYVQRPKRRGPGKANKSSRSKRGERIASPSTSIMEPERESMAESASPRQAYTSVMTLENFTFRPPTSPPRRETESQRPGSQAGSM